MYYSNLQPAIPPPHQTIVKLGHVDDRKRQELAGAVGLVGTLGLVGVTLQEAACKSVGMTSLERMQT
jgi:hypothetical protein